MKRNHFILIILALIFFGVLMRIIPHTPNATPVSAIILVCSWYFGKKWSIVIPLAVLFVSDFWLGFYDWKIQLSVYGSFVAIAFWSWIDRKETSFIAKGVTIVGSSFIFFLITNTSVWMFSPWYEKTVFGLLYAYELGIPFLRNMMVGDVFYTMLLVGVFEVIRMAYQYRIAYLRTKTCQIKMI